VQKLRESAIVTQCRNNLHQIAVGMQNYHATSRSFPSGGWGWNWIGVPSKGSGPGQPGGWIFSVLPYLEQSQLVNPPSGSTFQAGMTKMIQTPVPTLNCPSRRTGGPFPNGISATFNTADSNGSVINVTAANLARTCYAANCGNQNQTEIDGGPGSLDPTWNSTDAGLYSTFTGIFFRRSRIRVKDITRGSSNVLLVGEKYLNPQHYTDGTDSAENEGMYVGFDNDLYRTTYYDSSNPTSYYPRRDLFGFSSDKLYGSAHGGGFNVAYCDGHVDTIAYDIDLAIFSKMGTRLTDN
jgi:prepilin-type processing-associated H-X9-DG protein